MSNESQTSLVRDAQGLGVGGGGGESSPNSPVDDHDSPELPSMSATGTAVTERVPKKHHTDGERRRAEFRRQVGITATGAIPPSIEAALQSRRHRLIQEAQRREIEAGPDVEADDNQGPLADEYVFQHRLERAYKKQTAYYFFVAGSIYGMLCLQIAIGATLTALGSNTARPARVPITVLGATNTVIAGLLTFLKSRNQPNRAQQLRNGLRDVYEDLWRADAEMLTADVHVDRKVDELWRKYKDVRTEAENNYLDLWVALRGFSKQVVSGTGPGPGVGGGDLMNGDQSSTVGSGSGGGDGNGGGRRRSGNGGDGVPADEHSPGATPVDIAPQKTRKVL